MVERWEASYNRRERWGPRERIYCSGKRPLVTDGPECNLFDI